MTDRSPDTGSGANRSEGVNFAHASEAEMARILDFYGVRWEYEPHTFPILWNLDGAVVESFSPDFYLPDIDLYLEMTTLRQRLVRKKNRKLRRLRELYPDLRVKLFYARDFRALMLKYGKLALVEELSGTPGQVVPVRAVPAPGPVEPLPGGAGHSVAAPVQPAPGHSTRPPRSRRRTTRSGTQPPVGASGALSVAGGTSDVVPGSAGTGHEAGRR